MQKPFKCSIIISLNILLITTTLFAQKADNSIEFKQKDLIAYKTNHHVYNYWSHKNNWFNRKAIRKGDTLNYFTNEREYKGVINYGVECFSKNKSNCVLNENFIMFFLEVNLESFKYNPKDSMVNIKGFVKKGWTKKDEIGWEINQIDREKDEIGWENTHWLDNNSINIYVGQKKDTISKLYYEPYKGIKSLYSELIYKLNGKEIKGTIVLDSFPSFYIYDYKYYKTKKGSNRAFEIKAKINPNSILVFGLESCYTEIFEIGKLVFDSEDTRRKKLKIRRIKERKTKPNESYFKYIIRNTVQELYKDSISKPEKSWYYKVTETAEDYILKRQYGKAREEYRKLLIKNHYVFSRDIHNAVRATALSRDYKTAVLWCEKLTLKGIPLSYFNAQIFNKLRSTNHWSAFLLKHSVLKKQFEKGINQSLSTKLAELVAMDQKDYVAQSKGEFERSELYNTTERVNDKLISLLQQEGFPSEEKIGIKMLNDSIPKVSPDYQVLIYHSHQANSSRLSEIKEILSKNEENSLYDALRSNLNEMMNSSTCFKLYKGNLYYNKTCGLANKKQLELIDFSFNNKLGFIIEKGAFTILGYNKANEAEDTRFFEERFNFVKKITGDWYDDDDDIDN